MSSSSKKRDYYNILGVNRDATASEITKAFRKLARENHPDRGGSTENFQLINEAYSILKDPKKRRDYDLYGDASDHNSVGGDDFGTMFARSFFGNMMGSNNNNSSNRRRNSSRSSGRRKKRKPSGFTKVTSLEYKLSVSLEDLYKGVEKSFRIKRKKVIYPEGIERSDCFNTCEECEGYGQINTVKRLGNMIQQFTGPCGNCRGKGYNPKSGIELIEEVKQVRVNIEAGMEKGDQIIVEYVGDELIGYLPGDLLFIIDEKKHDTFLRKNNDLMIKLKINLQDALCGINAGTNKEEISIEHLDKHKIFLKSHNSDIIKPGSVRCICEEGMPSRYGDPGNLFIIFEVEFPEKLLPKQVVELRKAFELNDDIEKDNGNTAGNKFLSSFFGSKYFSNNNDNNANVNNNVDRAWLDSGKETSSNGNKNNDNHEHKPDKLFYYLNIATIDDFGRNLTKPSTDDEVNNKHNSRL